MSLGYEVYFEYVYKSKDLCQMGKQSDTQCRYFKGSKAGGGGWGVGEGVGGGGGGWGEGGGAVVSCSIYRVLR